MRNAISTNENLETCLSEQTSFEGTLISRDNITIHGKVKGRIECQGKVVADEEANIEADIVAEEVVISGKVLGNVSATTRLEICSGAVLQGDIKTPRLVIGDGSKLDGNCEMVLDGESVDSETYGNTFSEGPPHTQERVKQDKRIFSDFRGRLRRAALIRDRIAGRTGILLSKLHSSNSISARGSLACTYVLIIALCVFTYVTVSSHYQLKLRRMQDAMKDQLAETKHLVSRLEDYRNLLSAIAVSGKRKPVGTFTVTAYDPIESCKPFDDGITSTGIPAGMGVAAVDPRVIPYGSVLYIPDLGRYFLASDTGRAMRRGDGRNVDILMPTVEEALQFGKQRLKVELLGLGSEERLGRFILTTTRTEYQAN
jgi:cytoskeletal protein CcmA (bactofilin family)/3D (Asp-Asp-Asp) domain-containing protein